MHKPGPGALNDAVILQGQRLPGAIQRSVIFAGHFPILTAVLPRHR